MKSDKIRKAYDTISLTPEQEARMFTKIKSGAGSRYRARPVRENWLPILGAAVMLVVVMGLSIFYLRSSEQEPSPLDVVDSTETSTPNYDDEADSVKREMLIQDIKATYVKAIEENWDMQACDNADISRLTAYVTSPEKLGYALMDLDGNGTGELIISDGNVIFDLYAYSNGRFVHVICGFERDSYTLCESNYIQNIASGGAAYTEYNFYKLNETKLIPIESLVYDGAAEDGPWFRSHFQISATNVPVEEARALSILDSYQTVAIPITPLGNPY